ncbi:uncharacterized protein [Clytia hemisphaerica]|uniref:BHLH domain-containing protein n=1 Tax=Clytia hemisphaerica TaxID=252671 RepID=A0A7M5X956_9CNID
MSKRKFIEVEFSDQSPTLSTKYPPLIGRERDHVIAQPVKKKKNSFHVDNLLAEKTGSKKVEYLRPSHEEEKHPSPSVTPIHFTGSAFQRLYKKADDWSVYDRLRGGEHTGERCTKPCCGGENINLTKYPSSIHYYRSRESGSTDSAGSSCNSHKDFPIESEAFSKRRREAFEEDLSYHRQHHYKELRFPYEYERRDYPTYYQEPPRASSKPCACADCHLPKDYGYKKKESKIKQVNVIYRNDRDVYSERKPLSKRKALLNELENKVNQRSTRAEFPIDRALLIDSKQIKEEEEEIEVVDHNESHPLKHGTNIKRKSEEVLKLPAGPGRNRAVANLLERRRVAELNTAFEKLRILIPCYGNEDRALSKIKTLKYALTYMAHLMTIVREQTVVGHFNTENDFHKLSKHDPLIQKCREHMFRKKIFMK